MANLLSIAELAYRQIFPNPNDETKLRKGDFIATAKSHYATLLWLKSKQEKKEEGFWEVPSFLISEADFTVKDNAIDISSIKPLEILGNDEWIKLLGDFECPYVRSTISRTLAMKGDDALGSRKTFLRTGKRIIFPAGTYKNEVHMIYANNGETTPDYYEIDGTLAGTLHDKLIETYAGKVGKADVTNNTNPEQ